MTDDLKPQEADFIAWMNYKAPAEEFIGCTVIRFNFWQRLGVLFGKRVYVMTDQRADKQTWLCWPTQMWMCRRDNQALKHD